MNKSKWYINDSLHGKELNEPKKSPYDNFYITYELPEFLFKPVMVGELIIPKKKKRKKK